MSKGTILLSIMAISTGRLRELCLYFSRLCLRTSKISDNLGLQRVSPWIKYAIYRRYCNKIRSEKMYAVVEQGSKQYIVSEGDQLDIELTEVEPDAKTIELDKVLLVNDGKEVKLGKPYLDGAKVIASFDKSAGEAVTKGQKLYPAHLRRRKHSRKRIGHRQKYLRIKVDKIEV